MSNKITKPVPKKAPEDLSDDNLASVKGGFSFGVEREVVASKPGGDPNKPGTKGITGGASPNGI